MDNDWPIYIDGHFNVDLDRDGHCKNDLLLYYSYQLNWDLYGNEHFCYGGDLFLDRLFHLDDDLDGDFDRDKDFPMWKATRDTFLLLEDGDWIALRRV
jgi:hypothetical protein